jgi:hypothetical protein
MTYILNTNHLRGYKLTFADWFKFRLIEEFTYRRLITRKNSDKYVQSYVTLPFFLLIRRLRRSFLLSHPFIHILEYAPPFAFHF